MGKFNRGKRKSTTLTPRTKPVARSDGASPAQHAVTRIGKQSKFGANKAKAPGKRWNVPKRLGG